MKTLIFKTEMDCDVQTLYDFHADTANLPRITPPGIKVGILHLDTPLREGGKASLLITKHHLPLRWDLTFETVDEPNTIVDVATRSPFARFRHEHNFIRLDDTHSVLEDVVTFALPLEPLSSPIAWFIERDLKKMFGYRHQVTKSLLSS